MKFSKRCLWRQLLCLSAVLLLSGHTGVWAQTYTVTVTPMPYDYYQVGVSGLGDDDLVFYRYSDGIDQSAMNGSNGAQATVLRQFKNGNVSVSAFVARKGGGLGLAVGDINNTACPSCQLPSIGLNSGEYMRIRNSCWSPFVEPATLQSLSDTKTTPTLNTPVSPWFILPITIKAPAPSTHLNFNIPNGMTVGGAIVKNIWKQLSTGTNPITDADVLNFVYPNANSLTINMTTNYNNEFNVYLLVRSSTVLGQTSTFSGQLYSSSNFPLGSQSQMTLITRQNPHDPNVLTNFEKETCYMRTDNPPLKYRVDFQNLGEGKAENVLVDIKLEQRVLDALSLTGGMISSSHHLSSFETGPDYIHFEFNQIYLPGTGNNPQPQLQDTKGWVEFSVETQDCIPLAITGPFQTEAHVTFIGSTGFTETIATNKVLQGLRAGCGFDPLCSTLDWRPVTGTETITDQEFVPKCYPSLFNDQVTVEIPTQTPGFVTVTMTDLLGRTWLADSFQTGADAEKRTMETATLPAGMYLIQVNEGKNRAVFKVIKE